MIVPKLEEAHVHKAIIDCEIISYWEYPSPSNENWYDVINGFLKKYDRVGIENNVKAEVYFNIQAKELVCSDLVAVQRQVKSSLNWR